MSGSVKRIGRPLKVIPGGKADEILQDVLNGMSIEEALSRHGFLKATAGLALGAALMGSPAAASGARYLSPGEAGLGTGAAAAHYNSHPGLGTAVGERPSLTQDPIAYQVGREAGRKWAERGVLFKERPMPTTDAKVASAPHQKAPPVEGPFRGSAAKKGGVLLKGTDHQTHRPGHAEAPSEPSAADRVVKSVIDLGRQSMRTGRVDLPGVSIRLPKGARKAGQVIRQGERVYKQVTGPWNDRFGRQHQRGQFPPGPPRHPTTEGVSTTGVGASGSTGKTGAPTAGDGAPSSGATSGAGSSAKPSITPKTPKTTKQTTTVSPSLGGTSG